MKDIRQTQEYANYLSQTGWIVENLNGTFVYIKKLPLIGSIIKVQRPEKLNFVLINGIAQKHNAKRIVIEPVSSEEVYQLLKQNFKLSHSPFLPTKTLVIDLKMKNDKIINNFKNDARSSLGKTIQLDVVKTEDVQAFHTSWRKAAKSRLLLSSLKELTILKKSFENNCLLLVTKDFSAGAIFLKTETTVYYWKAFTSKKGRGELAQYRLVWDGIVWAKKEGAKLFDFEGIYDERFPLKNWRGFTHFKQSFGGSVVEYPGVFVKSSFL